MGLDYLYVDQGNDIGSLISAFQKVKDIDHPVVVHINTLKGKGYRPAEEHKEPGIIVHHSSSKRVNPGINPREEKTTGH